MTVKRIVANLAVSETAGLRDFYAGLFGLRVVMDHGWIVTLAAEANAAPQVSLATEGGSGTPVPDLSIEVDDLDAVLARVAAAGLPIAYGPAREPWGVRRFHVRDPSGRLLNVVEHEG